jgi:hypothetical protein
MARQQQKHRDKAKARNAGNVLPPVEETGTRLREAGEQAQAVARNMTEASREGSLQFAVLGEKAFESWIRSSNEALRRVLELNVELATWSHEQVDDGLNAVRSLAQCRTVGDAYGVQLGLMRSTMEKSILHASNVFNLAAHALVSGPARGLMRPTQAD